MNVVFICQAIDEGDPIQAGTVQWVRAMAARPEVERVVAIALRVGEHRLPANVDVHVIGGHSRPGTALRFYREVLRALPAVDCFFVYQGGPYPALLLPLKLLGGKRVYQWKAHPRVGRAMRFYARFCDTLVFTSTRNAFPLDLSNVRVVGQGIDTAMFTVRDPPRTGDLVTVGRISPIKRLDRLLRALARCNERHGTSYRLDIYGPTLERDREHRRELEALVEELGIPGIVAFRGPVRHEHVPDVLGRYRVFIHFCDGALDRSTVEAMSCALPVLSTNPCVEEAVPEELRGLLIVPREGLDAQADGIHRLLSLGAERLADVGRRLRETVVRSHGLDAMMARIVEGMVNGEAARATNEA